MKINNLNVNIPDHDIETIDNEIIIYIHKNKKIVSFNKTASIIWNIIDEEMKKNSDITTEYIGNKLNKIYKMSNFEKESVHNDVNEIINQFINEELILCNE